MWLHVAIQAEMVSRETVGEWIKLTVNVINIFKKGKDRIRRGEEVVWIPLNDFDCKCPKVRLQKTYLMMGNDVISSGRVGLIVDQNSVVMRWTEDLGRRLKQMTRVYDQNGKRCWVCLRIIFNVTLMTAVV